MGPLGPPIDSHVHLFDAAGLNPYIPYRCVGFGDIDYNHPRRYKDMPSLYDKYLPMVTGPGRWILATSMGSVDQLETIWKSHKEVIRGFGELKLYDYFCGKKVPYKKLSFLRDTLKLSKEVGPMPVYVHYIPRSARDVERLANDIADFPDVPIVLCHCCMDDRCENPDWNYGQVQQIALLHPNVFVDISWDALFYMYNNPMRILSLPTDRVLLGSDASPLGYRSKHPTYSQKHIREMMASLGTYINWDANVWRLFGDCTI